MTIVPIADIAGANAAVALGAAGIRARRIWLTASGSSNARFGNASVAAAKGVELPADVLVTISASDADIGDSIDLSIASVYVPSGTTVKATYGV